MHRQEVHETREILPDSDLSVRCEVIRRAFATVAANFSLTPQNCPSHPAFIAVDALRALHEGGARFLGLFVGRKQAGFVALRKTVGTDHSVEKLAVVPEHRHMGFSRMLMDIAFDCIRAEGGGTVSIAIVDGNRALKDWYLAYRFSESCTRRFEDLPFTVCFMTKAAG